MESLVNQTIQSKKETKQMKIAKKLKSAVKKIARKFGDFFRNVAKMQKVVDVVSHVTVTTGFIAFWVGLFTVEAFPAFGFALLIGSLVCFVIASLTAPVCNKILNAARKCEAKRQERIANAMKDPNVRKVVGLIRNAESNERLGNKEAASSFRAKAEEFIVKYKLDRDFIAVAV